MTQEIVSVEEFHTIIENAIKDDTYVIADFYTTWCGPCKQLAPVYAEIASEYAEDETIKFLKVNVQELEALGDEYEILSIPTLKFFKNGKVNEAKGNYNKQALLDLIALYSK